MKAEENRLLTKAEVCAKLGIKPTSVWNFVQKGKLTAIKVGRSSRYKLSEVTAILDAKKIEPMKENDTHITAELPEDRFERIGTSYYKLVRQPNAAGQLVERSTPWTIEAIRQDYGKDFLANIPKYYGFCCVPAHIDYQQVIGNFKNKYSPRLSAGESLSISCRSAYLVP